MLGMQEHCRQQLCWAGRSTAGSVAAVCHTCEDSRIRKWNGRKVCKEMKDTQMSCPGLVEDVGVMVLSGSSLSLSFAPWSGMQFRHT